MATTPTPPVVPPTASSRSLSGFTIPIAALILLALALVMGSRGTDFSSSSSLTSWLSPSTPQPQGRCEDSFAQDDEKKYDFSQSLKDRVHVNPGSVTKLCYGSLVSIPGDRWKAWGAQFAPPVGQKERCVAYFLYVYPDHSVKLIGPSYGPGMAFSDMSGLWRIATNCPIEYYRW